MARISGQSSTLLAVVIAAFLMSSLFASVECGTFRTRLLARRQTTAAVNFLGTVVTNGTTTYAYSVTSAEADAVKALAIVCASANVNELTLLGGSGTFGVVQYNASAQVQVIIVEQTFLTQEATRIEIVLQGEFSSAQGEAILTANGQTTVYPTTVPDVCVARPDAQASPSPAAQPAQATVEFLGTVVTDGKTTYAYAVASAETDAVKALAIVCASATVNELTLAGSSATLATVEYNATAQVQAIVVAETALTGSTRVEITLNGEFGTAQGEAILTTVAETSKVSTTVPDVCTAPRQASPSAVAVPSVSLNNANTEANVTFDGIVVKDGKTIYAYTVTSVETELVQALAIVCVNVTINELAVGEGSGAVLGQVQLDASALVQAIIVAQTEVTGTTRVEIVLNGEFGTAEGEAVLTTTTSQTKRYPITVPDVCTAPRPDTQASPSAAAASQSAQQPASPSAQAASQSAKAASASASAKAAPSASASAKAPSASAKAPSASAKAPSSSAQAASASAKAPSASAAPASSASSSPLVVKACQNACFKGQSQCSAIIFVSAKFANGKTTFTYTVRSGTAPAISHLNLLMPCGRPTLAAGTSSSVSYVTQDKSLSPQPNFPVKGLKWDQSFGDGEKRTLTLVLEGEWSAVEGEAIIKASTQWATVCAVVPAPVGGCEASAPAPASSTAAKPSSASSGKKGGSKGGSKGGKSKGKKSKKGSN